MNKGNCKLYNITRKPQKTSTWRKDKIILIKIQWFIEYKWKQNKVWGFKILY